MVTHLCLQCRWARWSDHVGDEPWSSEGLGSCEWTGLAWPVVPAVYRMSLPVVAPLDKSRPVLSCKTWEPK